MLRDLFSLFPAYAGVILRAATVVNPAVTFPRIRGGDPQEQAAQDAKITFSPHTRG